MSFDKDLAGSSGLHYIPPVLQQADYLLEHLEERKSKNVTFSFQAEQEKTRGLA